MADTAVHSPSCGPAGAPPVRPVSCPARDQRCHANTNAWRLLCCPPHCRAAQVEEAKHDAKSKAKQLASDAKHKTEDALAAAKHKTVGGGPALACRLPAQLLLH